MVEEFEKEIAKIEEDMQSQMSEAVSAKSRAQEILDAVAAEEEEKLSMTQSQKFSMRERDENDSNRSSGDEDEDDDKDDENQNVFYKASELIVSLPLSVFTVLLILIMSTVPTQECGETMAAQARQGQVH